MIKDVTFGEKNGRKFMRVPDELLFDKNLNASEVILILTLFTNPIGDGIYEMSYDKIAEKMNLSLGGTKKIVKRLVEKGYIEIIKVSEKGKQGTKNTYKILK